MLLGQRADGKPHGLLIEFAVEPADGYAERKSARAMLETALPGSRRITLGADKGCDTAEFVAACRALKVTSHIARNEGRAGGSALNRRTARHAGYAVSQRVPKRVEEIFGWMKTVGGVRKTLSRPRPHPIARLSGGCRLQPAPHRQTQPGPCMKYDSTTPSRSPRRAKTVVPRG